MIRSSEPGSRPDDIARHQGAATGSSGTPGRILRASSNGGFRAGEMQGRRDGSSSRRLIRDARSAKTAAHFAPHLSACFLDVDEHERIVFTNALVGGWRPAEQPFMTAIITLRTIRRGPTTPRT